MAIDWINRLYVKQDEIEGPFGGPSPIPFWACGPASLLTCLKLLGNRQATAKTVFKAVGVSLWKQIPQLLLGGGGTDEHQLARGAKRLGYKAQIRWFSPGAKRKAWAYLIGCSQRGVPAMLGVDDDTHWIVAYGTDKDGAWIMDPADGDSVFEYWDRESLLDRWLCYADPDEDGDEDCCDPDGFGLLSIVPAKTRTREFHRRYACPPGDFLLSWIDDEEDAADLVELREDIDTIFSDIPQRTGQRAIECFAGRIQRDLLHAVCNWSGDIKKRWVRERLDLIYDLLWHLPYRVPKRYEEQFIVELAVLVTADALVAAKVDPGDGDPDEVLTYEEDAATIFSKRGSGTPAHEFLSRHQNLLTDRVSNWLECSTPASVRAHLRCLVGEVAGNGLRAPRGRARKTLVEVAMLLTIYDWLCSNKD